MADDEYELLPRAELDHLRKEVERLKRNPLGDTQASISLLESLNKLNDNVSRLVQVLESANDEMVKALHDNSVQEQLRKLREENAKIAHGIVAVAELVKGVRVPVLEQRSPPPMAQPAPKVAPPPLDLSPEEPAFEPPVVDIPAPEEASEQVPQRRNPFLTPGQREIPPILDSPLPHPGEPVPPKPPRADEIPPPPPR